MAERADDLQLESEHCVHIWHIDLSAFSNPNVYAAKILSPDERRRAERFSRAVVRRRFIASHVALRDILSRYLGRSPREIQLCCTLNGKPYLPAKSGSPLPRFSLSHSGEAAMLAVAHSAIGVDIERIDPAVNGLRIAERFFSPAEFAALQSAPLHEQTHAFFAVWARKEAYLKARGEGIQYRLHTFTVTIPSGPAGLIDDLNDPMAATQWKLLDIETKDGFAAALAMSTSEARISHFRWAAKDTRL